MTTFTSSLVKSAQPPLRNVASAFYCTLNYRIVSYHVYRLFAVPVTRAWNAYKGVERHLSSAFIHRLHVVTGPKAVSIKKNSKFKVVPCGFCLRLRPFSLGRVQQHTGRIGLSIGTTCVRRVSC